MSRPQEALSFHATARMHTATAIMDTLHEKVLKQLEALWKARGLTQEEAITQQTWNTWKHGASFKLATLEKYVRRLDGELRVEIVDRLAGVKPALPIRVSPEAVEIAAVVDRLTDAERAAIVEAVHNLARTFATLRQPEEQKARK